MNTNKIINFFNERPLIEWFKYWLNNQFIIKTFNNCIDGITLEQLYDLCKKEDLYCSITTSKESNYLIFKFESKNA